MQRRDFLRLGAATAGAVAFGPDFWRRAYGAPAQPGDGPYGALTGRTADANGIILPEGFESRLLLSQDVCAKIDLRTYGGVGYAHILGELLPDFRRAGIGSQLMEAAQGWAAQHNYETIRLECHNQHRPMLHLAIDLGYDIVGIRWDADRGDNLVVFEKNLTS